MRTVVLALCVIPALAALAPAAERRPNVILLLADDLGWGDVGFNGRTDWQTPHLDRLAREGTVFRRWYTAAVVCAPSRAALMTGKYPIHNGVVANNDDLPDEEVTVAEALKAHGYATALFGKWHHGKPRPGHKDYVHPMDHGFDEFFGFTDAVHAWEHFPKELWSGREKKPVEGYADTLFADRGIDFIRRNKDRPFFLYLAFTATHLHIEAPAEDVAEYKGKFKEKDPAKPLNATYAAMVSRLDKEVGRVLQTLDDLKLAEQTLVVFSSDHGATFEVGNQGTSAFHDSNRPFRGQKRTLWEGGTRAPAVVRWPGQVPAGKVSSDPVHNIDVLPTFLAAVGAEPKPEWKVDGRDLLPVWAGKEKAPERTLFWEWRSEGTQQLAALRGDFKLVITGGNRPELFNVEADPAERRSVIAEHPDLAKQLQQELNAWLATETEAAKWGKEKPKPAGGAP
jgi:arylsulfatase A